mmetsp:Transcript_26217/g.55154  ORF Transcript_26217/g.55154 Transcript_26217/m.55154 type:complete len:96 (-) Transcript_26217:218-505(-)
MLDSYAHGTARHGAGTIPNTGRDHRQENERRIAGACGGVPESGWFRNVTTRHVTSRAVGGVPLHRDDDARPSRDGMAWHGMVWHGIGRTPRERSQ